MSRQKLFNLLGINDLVSPLLKTAYDRREENIWRASKGDTPHGYAWHTRFHASSFPGSYESCGRKAIYSLLGVPDDEPMSGLLRAYAEIGQDAEERIVRAFDEHGSLLSAGPDEKYQTNFIDKEAWLSGNVDCVILLPFWKRPHVVEIKSRGVEKVKAMKAGLEECDPDHENQCRAYMHMAHNTKAFTNKKYTVTTDTWQIVNRDPIYDNETLIELEPCTSGSVFYIARDNPSITHEFYFEYNEEWYNTAREKLLNWQEFFKEEKIPERPHHEDGKLVGWSKHPCEWCKFKPQCKLDYKEEISNLRESNVVKSVEGNYNYAKKREEVFDAWS